ncbi:EamA/RhaT family transporter, partial [Cupriavidus sp. CER94]
PLFAAVLSTVLLGDSPHWYHAAGLVCIGAGIWLAQRR